ncbi:hypothetical protein V6N11_000644 [Hibiscus sabdariffa]|uniref:Uncharacterized protein n=1 Tax=Hibiscus sabdariffa TaxID=183260 RepID=A0ABR2NEQ4_9ROSI
MYINIAASVVHPAGTSAHQLVDLGDNFEHEVPNLSMMDEVEKRIKGDMKKAYEEKFRCLEEKLRAIQGEDNQGNDASELSLVADLVLPPKFKAPDFDKYDGTTGPSAHITMYCRKMEPLSRKRNFSSTVSKKVWVRKKMRVCDNMLKDVTSGSEQGVVKKYTRPPRKDNEKMAFTPLPILFVELYTQLYKADLVRPYIVAPFQPPYPAWYDEKAHYDYHGGIPGHSIENCTAFKKVAQNLIKAGVLKFDNPNVAANPLPNHGGRSVNTIDADCVRKTKGSISEVTTPMRWVFRRLCMARLIDRGMVIVHEGSRPYCEYHQEEGHDIQLCEEFRHLVQSIMDNKEIEFFERMGEGRNSYVCTSEEHRIKYGVDRPLAISLKPREETYPQEGEEGTQDVEKSHGEAQPAQKEGSPEKEVVNEVGHFTRSERCYSPEIAKTPEASKDKGKTAADELEKIFGVEPLPKINEPVTEMQAQKFLNF